MPTIRWPDHWYHGQDRIRCIVPYCGFLTDTYAMAQQWTQIHDHCMAVPGAEHDLLEILLRQKKCAIDDCGQAYQNHPDVAVRHLLNHEKSAHGSAAMSDISSFVRLAREGRIRTHTVGPQTGPEPNCERFAFVRMKEKIWALPAGEISLLFQKSGLDDPNEHTDENLGKILTHDPLKQPGDDPPPWWPVNVEHFLWFCRPHPTDPADHTWRILWNDLRAKYADGRI